MKTLYQQCNFYCNCQTYLGVPGIKHAGNHISQCKKTQKIKIYDNNKHLFALFTIHKGEGRIWV